MKRESFGSRIGFILLSAGCAIGIGNVWRFPYVVGENGGGVFVLFYIFFLVVIGVPILSMEFSVGRASRKSPVKAFQELEKPGAKWHIHGYSALIGNYCLMFFYTTVAGWMMYYFYSFVVGDFEKYNVNDVQMVYQKLLQSPEKNIFWMLVIVTLGIAVCSMGLQNGVERITKIMMSCLLVLMVVLAIQSFFMDGGMEGVRFYLYPDFGKVKEVGLINVVTEAMNQAFFTLSIGIGSMAIFGSYLGKDRSLLGESLYIAGLDTFVAIVSGLIIFPACFAYGVSPDSGPSLIFITLPHIFVAMNHGRILGSFFFLFMAFASLSTVIAVFENIIACNMELFKITRMRASFRNFIIIAICSAPCGLGFNLLKGIQPLGSGSTILDLEDFIVSNILLPIGSLIYLLFCTSKWGWGFDNYLAEANTGRGVKMRKGMRIYLSYVLPVVLVYLLIRGWIAR